MGSRAIVSCVVLFLAGSVIEAVSAQETPAPGAPPGRAHEESERARFAGRFADRELMRTNCRAGAELALERGLAWLAAQQESGGSWKLELSRPSLAELQQPDGSWKTTAPPPAMLRYPSVNDVGLTGLAILAFLGNGDTQAEGRHAATVARALAWLGDQQDLETGLFGEKRGYMFLYNHAIATLAVAEAQDLSPSARLESSLRRAVKLILRARNPYGAWRYDVPPVGDNDTSVTGWMVTALTAAEHAGVALAELDDDAYEGALAWIRAVTDPESGRVGYDSQGSVSSRVVGVNEHMPPERGEAMTAVGLAVRIQLGERAERQPMLARHAQLILRKLPEWDTEGYGCDMVYWYFGSYAMHQMGGELWDAWHSAMERALLPKQVEAGAEAGSWDPIGPWGYAGGRVYSTALMALCLETPFRYGR